MNQYHDHSRTPLLFHKIYWLIWTPAQIIMGAMTFFDSYGGFDSMSLVEKADLGYGVLTCLLMITYYIGFLRWKRYGWYALMAQLVTNVIYAFVALGVQWNDDRAFATSLVIGTLIRCIPVGIYYYKRRPLFTPKGIDMPGGSIFFGGVTPQNRQSPYGSHNPYNNQNPYNGQSVQNGQSDMQNMPQNNPYTQQWHIPTEQPQPVQEKQNDNFNAEGERIYYCPECGGMVKQHSVYCIHCGAKMK